jgi:hypothetical protein
VDGYCNEIGFSTGFKKKKTKNKNKNKNKLEVSIAAPEIEILEQGLTQRLQT